MGSQSAGMAVDIAADVQDQFTNYVFAKQKAKELREAQQQARGEVEKAYTTAKGYQEPYYNKGTQMFNTLADMVKSGAFDTKVDKFTYAPEQQYKEPTYKEYQQQQFNFQADPGYKWRLQQGLNAVQNTAAARGSGLSGATLAAMQKYVQGFASNEYQNAWNRNYRQNEQGFNQNLLQNEFSADVFNKNRTFGNQQYTGNREFDYKNYLGDYTMRNQQDTNRYSRFNDMAQYGQYAGTNLSNLATSYGDTLANIAMNRGNIDAAEWADFAAASHAQAQDARNFGNKYLSSGAMNGNGKEGEQGSFINFGSGQ